MMKFVGLTLPALALVLVGCSSDSPSVASVVDLHVEEEPKADAIADPPTADAVVLDITPETEPIEGEEAIEEAVMGFTQCMRDEGLQLLDTGVDRDGNVQRPVPAEGFEATRQEWVAGFEACSSHLEGIILGADRLDETELEDRLLELAQCLREHGLDVPDPDPSLPNSGRQMLSGLDFQDPAIQEVLEKCDFQELLNAARGVGGQ